MAATSTLPPEQRHALLAAKLGALVARHPDGAPADPRPGTLPGGVTLRDDHRGWVLLEDEPHRAVGVASAWAARHGVAPEIVADAPVAALLARRAARLADGPRVWAVEGDGLAVAAPAPYQPLQLEPPAGTETLVDLLRSHDLEVVVEGGRVIGEVLGLEVARIADDEPAGHRLEVGVGSNDREVVAMVHGQLPAGESLAAVAAVVRRHRSPVAEPHPLNRLAPERWLRSQLLADPSRVGLRSLEPLPSIDGRRGLRETQPAAAVGRTADGEPVVVVTSIGIDLDLVPTAADLHAWWAASTGHVPGEVGLRLVLPARDAIPLLEAMAASLLVPAEIVTVPSDWRR